MSGRAQRTGPGLSGRRWSLDLIAAGLLLGIPVVGFWPSYAGPGYLVPAIGGLALGAVIAALGAWRQLNLIVLTGMTAAAYFIFGGVLALPETTIAGFIPTLETWRSLAVGVVTGWKDMLTTVAPLPTGEGFALIPFLLSLVAAVVTVSLALRVRTVAWALIPALVFLGVQIAMGTPEPAWPVAEGVTFAVVAIVWLALRQSWTPAAAAVSVGTGASAATGTRRLVTGAGVVAVAVAVGVGASGFVIPESPRYVLRDVVIPPFDIREYPSPMQGYRGLVRDFQEKPLFTATGLPEGARIRLAAMDAYSGIVYNVTAEGIGSSGAYLPVRADMAPNAQGTRTTVRVEIFGYRGVWLPQAGFVDDIVFGGSRGEELRRNARYNLDTQTGVVSIGLTEGDAYDLDVVIPPAISDDALVEVPFAPLRMPKQDNVPQDLAALASDVTAEAESPIEQVRSLQKWLAEGGFFSHGLEGEPHSRAGHGAQRIMSMLGAKQMVGDDEQYAVAMTLLAREIGIPARVVMGFYPDEVDAAESVFSANGDNMHAWVEVAFEGIGWVPFDPTPPEDQIPAEQTTKPKSDPQPQVLQPPPPVQEPVDLPPTVPDDRETEDEDPFDAGWLILIAQITGWTLLVIALLLAPYLIIGALKAARRRRRQQAPDAAARISGGWDEVVDRAVDYGTAIVPGSTRREDAVAVQTAFVEPGVATLARRADADVFGPSEPTEEEIEGFWREVDDIVGVMGARASKWDRLRARLNLRSLLARTRFALRPRSTSVVRPPVADRPAPAPPAPVVEAAEAGTVRPGDDHRDTVGRS